jgi:hypothetical protein
MAIDWAGTDPCYAHRRRPGTRATGRCGPFRTSTPPPFRPAFTSSVGGKATGRARRGMTRRTPQCNDAGGRISPRDL